MQYLCFCYSGDLKYTTKVYALKDYPAPPWYYWDQKVGLSERKLSHWGSALEGIVGYLVSSSFLCFPATMK
jgi:hypothetical protein